MWINLDEDLKSYDQSMTVEDTFCLFTLAHAGIYICLSVCLSICLSVGQYVYTYVSMYIDDYDVDDDDDDDDNICLV